MLELTTGEISQVRRSVDTGLPDSTLSNDDILSSMVVGEATDYVILEATKDLNVSLLSSAAQTAYRDVYGPNGLSTFLTDFLSGGQAAMFRRAVLFRSAGNSILYLRGLLSESGVASQEFTLPDVENKQEWLYAQADQQIDLLRAQYPEGVVVIPALGVVGVIGDDTGIGAYPVPVPSYSGNGAPGTGASFDIDALVDVTPSLSDWIGIYDESEKGLRKSTIEAVLNLASQSSFSIGGLTEVTPALTDYIPIADSSDSNANKKALLSQVLGLYNLEDYVTKKSLFSENKFWGSFRGSAVATNGEWTFLNASNGVVSLLNDALTSTEVSSIRFLSIHEDVFPNSDWINSTANQDNSTGFTQLQMNGGTLYIYNTRQTDYGTIVTDYFTITITASGSSKTGSVYKLACTVTQTGSVWNGNAWYAFDFDVVSVQKLQAQQLVDVQTLFAHTFTIQNSEKLLVMSGGMLGNLDVQTLLSRYVEIADLIGDDSVDFYGDFQSAAAFLPVQTTNKQGSWSIATGTGAPLAANFLDYKSIGDGNYILIFGATMQTSDWKFLSSAFTASQFVSGDILYIHPYDPYNADDYFKATLTGNAVLVGTGSAAYLYMPVTIDEVGDVTDPSDGWRISESPPTSIIAGLRGRLPKGTGLPALSQSTEMLLADFAKVTLARLGKHIRPDTTEPTDIPSTFEATNSDIKNGNNLIGILNPPQAGDAQVKWGLGATVNDADGNSIAESEIQDRLNVHHDITISASGVVLKGRVDNFSKNSLPNDVHYLINLSDATLTGTFTDGLAVTIEISSNLVGRDEFSVIAFGKVLELASATPVGTDSLAFYDASNGGLRRASLDDILSLASGGSFSVHETTTGTPAASDYLVFSAESVVGDPNRKALISDILALYSIDDLTAETTIADTDLIAIYDGSASAMRKMTRSNFLAGIANVAVNEFELSNVTESDTNLVTGANNEDVYALTGLGAITSDQNNFSAATVIYKFSDIETTYRWLPVRGAVNGQRFQFRRNGTNIQVRRAGNVVTTNKIYAYQLAAGFDITLLTAETAPTTSDELAVYDVSAAAMRKVTIQNMLSLLQSQTFSIDGLTAVSPATTDYIPIADTSDSNANKKVLLSAVVGLVDTFSGNYNDLTNKPTIPAAFSITALTTGTPVSAEDYLPFSAESVVGDPNRKALISDILALYSINDLTAETTVADTDLISIYDDSASAMRKMTRANFLSGVGGGFDIHDDVSSQLTTPADVDRLAISDESETGDPQKYIELQHVADYVNAKIESYFEGLTNAKKDDILEALDIGYGVLHQNVRLRISLTASKDYAGITGTDTDLYLLNNTDNRLEKWSFAGVEDTSARVSLANRDFADIVRTATEYWLLNKTSGRIEKWSFAGVEDTSARVTLTVSQNYRGLIRTSTEYWLLNNTADRIEKWSHAGVEDTSARVSIANKIYNDFFRTSTEFWLLNRTDYRLEKWSFAGVESVENRLALTDNKNYTGLMLLPDRWVILDNTSKQVEAWQEYLLGVNG